MTVFVAFILGTTLVAAAKLRQGVKTVPSQLSEKPLVEGYSFAQFVRDFDRDYILKSEEYNQRAALFQDSLTKIHRVNVKNQQDGSQWQAGIHPFMDWTRAERNSLKGYKPNRGVRSGFAGLQVSVAAKSQLNASWSESGSADVASGEGISLRNQGTCGSCWAISAVEAVEARLPGNTRISAQALVDCVPNPHHCGGSGGCDGATGELAYEYTRDHGLPLESDYAYTGKDGSCQSPTGQRAKVTGWTNVPSNNAQSLMDALYNSGPVVVAVAADDWFDYDNGIYDGCKKDATLDHAVLAKGYGGQGDGMWWRIQNSWGANWGEQGHIRLKRRPAAAEEAFCGQDRKPSDGVGCDGGPAEVTVCGSCGLLYDPLYPEGVTLEGADTATVSSQNPGVSVAISRDYQDYFKDDIVQPQVSSPQVETAVSKPVDSASGDIMRDAINPQSTDSFRGDLPATEASPLALRDLLAGGSADSTKEQFASGASSQVNQEHIVQSEDKDKGAVQRMKDLFRTNFMQAKTIG
jgi:cathepsin L